MSPGIGISFFGPTVLSGRKEVKEEFVRGWSQVFRGYEQVLVDKLSEGKWERWKRGE